MKTTIIAAIATIALFLAPMTLLAGTFETQPTLSEMDEFLKSVSVDPDCNYSQAHYIDIGDDFYSIDRGVLGGDPLSTELQETLSDLVQSIGGFRLVDARDRAIFFKIEESTSNEEATYALYTLVRAVDQLVPGLYVQASEICPVDQSVR